MKMECDVIRDLLPLYAEGMVSEKSRTLVEDHLKECDRCRAQYEHMTSPEPQVQFRKDPAQNYKKYVRKRKLRFGGKVALITAAVIVCLFLSRLAVVGGLVTFLAWGSMQAEVEADTDVSHYTEYMGQEAKEEYRNKWDMDESIFPAEITEDMSVSEYEMVYYNPWDAQYLSYLTVTYDAGAYAAEVDRLERYPSTDYIGYYGVTGFAADDDPLAIYADDYQGFVYAIHTPGMEHTITYVEIIFCNYYMDLDYTDYIPLPYLPQGFDATDNNPYLKEQLGRS